MRTRIVFGLFFVTVTSAACGRGNSAGAGAAGAGRGAMPAMAVEIANLDPKPVEQTTEYVGIVKSRQSTSIQPQVEGYITSIFVQSGARVARGAPLMDIDSRTQQAAVSSLETVKAQREIDVTYAKQ